MKSQLRLLGGQRIQSPKGLATRPTTSRVREAAMNLLGRKINNSNWLDLCSGSGVMSCEALQRGAKRIVAIEKDRKTAKTCKANLISIAASRNQKNCTKVICNEVIRVLKQGYRPNEREDGLDSRFDLVYLDPPYDSKIYEPALKNLLEGNWIKNNSLVICEHSSSIVIDIPESWNEQDRRIYGRSALSLVTPQSTSSPILVPG